MDSISTYSDARSEYLKQLSTWIAPHMIHHYRNLWSECIKRGGEQKAMLYFQEKCMDVPKWNQDTIDENVNKLLDICRCDYLEELMAAVFIAHTKVLIAIRVSSKHKKLQITLPKLDHFLHRVFSECARNFWKAPFLFLGNQQPIEMQKNLLQAESLCVDGISSAVRSLLPIKNILNEYLSDEVHSAEPIVDNDDKNADKQESTSSGGDHSSLQTTKSMSNNDDIKTVSTKSEPVIEEIKTVSTKSETVNEEIKTVNMKSEPVNEEIKTVSMKSEPVNEEIKLPVINTPEHKIEQPEEIIVDTKPSSIHFSNYDNVFDELNEQVSTFKYAPKNIEDNETPLLEIKESIGTPLSMDAVITNLETPGVEENEIMADAILE